MRSIYLSRRKENRDTYLAFKRALSALHRPGDSWNQHFQYFYQETGCKIVEQYFDNKGYFRSAVVEFEHDEDYTMFMLKWS